MTEFESYLTYWSARSRAERERRDADAGDLHGQRGTGGKSPAESHLQSGQSCRPTIGKSETFARAVWKHCSHGGMLRKNEPAIVYEPISSKK